MCELYVIYYISMIIPLTYKTAVFVGHTHTILNVHVQLYCCLNVLWPRDNLHEKISKM